MAKYAEVKQFKLTQDPVVKDTIIILHAVDAEHTRQKCVYFPGYRDAADTAVIKDLKANKIVYLEGKYQPDRRTNEMQFIVDRVSHAKDEQAVINTTAIDIPGDISPSIQVADKPEPELKTKKYTFPDGKFFWSDGIDGWRSNGRRAKLTFEFVEKYNSMVTLDNYLLPDWYLAEAAKRTKEAEALLEELATY